MTEITFLPVNNYPDTHHSQGGMKFATQISPLLNYQITLNRTEYMRRFSFFYNFGALDRRLDQAPYFEDPCC